MDSEMNLFQGPWCENLMELLLQYIICRSEGLGEMGNILTRGGDHPVIVGPGVKVEYTGDSAAKAQQANGISQPEKPV